MSVGQTFLGLLEGQPRHGYDLKRVYDERFSPQRPLQYGQVYATLSRLLKHGLVEVEAVEPGGGPDRKRYAITEAGITDVQTWLSQPERPEPYLQNVLYTKVVLALLTKRSAEDILDVLGRYVQVGHRPQRAVIDRVDQHPTRLQRRQQSADVAAAEEDDVRLRRRRYAETQLAQAVREAPRVAVILREALDVMLERM